MSTEMPTKYCGEKIAITAGGSRRRKRGTKDQRGKSSLKDHIVSLYGEGTYKMTRRLGKTRSRYNTTLNDIDFLRRCRAGRVTPPFLRAKRHIGTIAAQRIYDKMEGAMLRERIRAQRYRLWQLKKEGETLSKEVEEILDENTWQAVDRITKEQAERIKEQNAERKRKKWHKLTRNETADTQANIAPPTTPISNGPCKGHQRPGLYTLLKNGNGGPFGRATATFNGSNKGHQELEQGEVYIERTDRNGDTSGSGGAMLAPPTVNYGTRNKVKLIGPLEPPGHVYKKARQPGATDQASSIETTTRRNTEMRRTANSSNGSPNGHQPLPRSMATPGNGNDRLVVNLSGQQLSDEVVDILRRGLNFSVTPKRVPVEELVTCVEAGLEGMAQEVADEIRLEAAIAIRRARPLTGNVTAGQRKALNDLRKNEDLVVTRADKGNATVVMDRAAYNSKMEALLDPLVYEKGIKDPTRSIESKIKKILKNSGLDKKLIKEMEPDDSRVPRIYGLPKIHKEDIPFRPIISMIGAPTYKTSKALGRMLRPHAGNTPSFVKNSEHLVEIIKDLKLDPGDRLVSFDVESLFTNVPVKESIEMVERKGMLEGEMFELFKLCLTSCYFQFQNVIYKQRDGVAMGSPLSSVIANLFMEDFEEKALSNCPLKPKLWLRYVDDVFAVWPHGNDELAAFLNHLNSRHPAIKFTMEEEENGRLPFLDLLIIKQTDGKLAHTVYRKPTATGRYLHASSHHHPSQKRGVARTLVHRAFKLCSHPHYLNEELKRLTEELVGNGYKRWEIQSVIRQVKRSRNVEAINDKEPRAEKCVSLPFVEGLSTKIGRWFQKHKVDVTYKPMDKLSELLGSTKDRHWLQDRGVYMLPCDCGEVYIGQTGKKVATRIGQHTADYKHARTKTSAVAQHGSVCRGQMLFDKVKVLAREEGRTKRLVREAVEIYKRPNNFNKDDGFSLPAVWKPLFMKTKEGSKKMIGPARSENGALPLASHSERPGLTVYKGGVSSASSLSAATHCTTT